LLDAAREPDEDGTRIGRDVPGNGIGGGDDRAEPLDQEVVRDPISSLAAQLAWFHLR
jgi:hypothetical protein